MPDHQAPPPSQTFLSYDDLAPKDRVLEVIRRRFYGPLGLSGNHEKRVALRVTMLTAEEFVGYADEWVEAGALRCELRVIDGREVRNYWVGD